LCLDRHGGSSDGAVWEMIYMRKDFWDNPYQCLLETKVKSVDDNEVTFESTIAYSFSGGQESDKAFVNGLLILNSRIDDSLIHYMLPQGHGLSVGDNVTMTIDWPRRNRLMRLHFAAELILVIVTQKWGLEKVGAHISETKARIDFRSDKSISEKLPKVLLVYNDIIDRNLVIEKGYLNQATQRRYWKIEGLAEVPCGGTHVNTTSEVGYVKLKREHPGKSVERIEIKLVDQSPGLLD
jgi:Ser-tRNA(Ala) deacylase AlaX